ncbi:MAG TPA: methyltransferase domain-containing protein [Caulobacteraceae bacterium]
MERLNLGEESPYSPSELAIHSVRYLPVKELVKGKNVLDAACGEGLGSFLMHSWGAKHVVGVDNSAEAVRNARRRFARPGLTFQHSDINAFLKGRRQAFDLITCIETIEHLGHPVHTLKQFAIASRKNSLIYVTCPNDPWYYGRGESLNEFHVKTYTFEAFRALSEGVLGPAARWYLGGVATGYVTVPLEEGGAGTYDQAVAALGERQISGILAPAGTGEPLTPEKALYYGGVWTRGQVEGELKPSVATWPAGSDYRLSGISQLPAYGHWARPGNTIFLADWEDVAAREALIALRQAWRGRLPAKFLLARQKVRERLLTLAVTRSRASHVHLFGERLARLVLDDPQFLARARAASKLEPEDFLRRWSQPSLSFSLPQGEGGTEWAIIAPLFDAFAVAEEAAQPLSRRQVLIIRAGEGEAETREWLRRWMELLRRAEGAASAGMREARAAVWRRQLAQAATGEA